MKQRPSLACWLVILLLTFAPGAVADPAACLLSSAREQVGVTTTYDGSYVRLAYPYGDVPIERGVCTDVLVRAYRKLGVDLQQRVHEDMRGAWDAYPRHWGLTRPDRNIDHRRVPNLAVFFARHGEALPISTQARDYHPGDLVTWRLPGNLPHIGIVSDRRNAQGTPLVVHNIGAGTQEEAMLFDYPITGRYRYFPPDARDACAP